jgi:hypothetical protein
VPQRYCDIFSELYDAAGNLIAHPDGGISGQGDGRAPDFFASRLFVRTVWADSRGGIEGRQLILAPIDAFDIVVLESFPVQYRAEVTSGLPNGCTRFERWDAITDQATRTVMVSGINSVPSSGEIACTLAYGMVKYSIPLDGLTESGVTYTVDVNGTTRTITTQ